MMTNEEFEVAFDSSNRNNNHQFAFLFTPLAQENILALLSDNEVGFGDDFDFKKDRMINTIIPEHLQSLDLDMDPEKYMSFDLGGLSSSYGDIINTQAQNVQSQKLQQTVDSDYSNATADELMDACKQFEAYFFLF